MEYLCVGGKVRVGGSTESVGLSTLNFISKGLGLRTLYYKRNKDIPPDEVLKALTSQDKVKLFTTIGEAKAYTQSTREFVGSNSSSKHLMYIAPIFSVEIKNGVKLSKINLSLPFSLESTLDDISTSSSGAYDDEETPTQYTNGHTRQFEISFYEINPTAIKKIHSYHLLKKQYTLTPPSENKNFLFI